MLTCACVDRLLSILENRPNRKVKTAIYASKTADVDNLGRYVRQFLEDEQYISRGGYKFEYDSNNVYIDGTDNQEMFKYLVAQEYEVIFVLAGEEEDELCKIIKSLPDDNNSVFIPMDCKLRAYRMLDTRKQSKTLKRKVS